MSTLSIEKNTVQETLLIPLYARKLGNELFPHILYDPYADATARRLDCDFSVWDKKKDTLAWKFGALEGILRSKDMLCEMQDYIRCHPDAAVVNLGCGLDATPRLGDNGQLKLYHIDRESVMTIRQAVLPPQDRETYIAADITEDPWIRRIPSPDVFFWASGVFMYLTRDEVYRLISRLTTAFPHGCLVFDTVNRLAIKVLMKTTLETLGIHGIDGLFYCNNPLHDFSWMTGSELSVRKYMTGYVDLKQEGVPPLLRGMAYLFDWIFKMNICRITWK